VAGGVEGEGEEKGAAAAEAGEGERRRGGGGEVGDLGGFCLCAEVDRSAQTGYAYAAVDASVQPSLYLGPIDETGLPFSNLS
jgi:hypothetical protein